MTNSLQEVFSEILESTRLHLSSIKPSEWYESKMIMPRGSAFPGPFSFERTPYWREPLDCVAKEHPAKEISIMKGAQSGGTAAVLNPIVGYTITQNPGNIMFLTGHSDLSQAAFLKIDSMFDNCRIRHLIKPNIVRAKNTRSGDTDKLKEFPGGTLWGGSVTNHNLLRQYDVMVMIVDDFDAAPTSSKKAGSTRALVQQRTAAYAYKKKIVYVSSPQLKGSSNIESVFELGDKRYYNVPCPCCGAAIVLKWNIKIDGKENAGITWKVDDDGRLLRKSVGYICQECAGFFTDSHKYEMNLAGFWKPTVIPIEEDHYSYQLSSLYSPPGMDDWAHYVQQYMNANPVGRGVDEKKYQTFVNVVLGESYEQKGRSVEASAVQKKIRSYAIDTVPETLSIKDGNGTIVMLTCACDLNGTEHDARLDYEIVAWSETGSSYSIRHGSIGTFVPKENAKKFKIDREHWTYEFGRERCVWPELEKILNTTFSTDTDRPMRILLTGVDCGHYTNHAYSFIDRTPFTVTGVKGDKEGKYRVDGSDSAHFKPAKERPKLFLLDVNGIKDIVSANIDLKWLPGAAEVQPPGYMNFPEPANGLYHFDSFFAHYESEHRAVEVKDDGTTVSRWVKKKSDVPGQKGNLPNHFWDVYIYNYCLKEIWALMTLKAAKPPQKGNWHDFIAYLRLNKFL